MDRLPSFSALGYTQLAGLFLSHAVFNEAYLDLGLDLSWYKSYNNQWIDSGKCFNKHTDLTAPTQACESLNDLRQSSGLEAYSNSTGDMIRTHTVGDATVAAC
jgi:hypothetical protein